MGGALFLPLLPLLLLLVAVVLVLVVVWSLVGLAVDDDKRRTRWKKSTTEKEPN